MCCDASELSGCFVDLGLKKYRDAYDIQRRVFDDLVAAKRSHASTSGMERVFLVEHTPVYTLGFHANENNILRHVNADYVRIERGGDVTFHGPGQLVVYPVLDLELHGLGVKDYVHLLEESVIRLSRIYGVECARQDGAPGVWLGNESEHTLRKLCALGVKCTRFITLHGLALNVSTDLNFFKAINPCGFNDRGVTSYSNELGDKCPDMGTVKRDFVSVFSSLLK